MRILLLFFIFLSAVFAEQNLTADNSEELRVLNERLGKSDEELKGNVWITRYSNYNIYQRLNAELGEIDALIKKQGKSASEKTLELQKKQMTIKEQIELLREFEKAPFSNMITAPEIEILPEITNPFLIISGFSYIKQLRSKKDEYRQRIESLNAVIDELSKREAILSAIVRISGDEKESGELFDLRQEINEFTAAAENHHRPAEHTHKHIFHSNSNPGGRKA